MARQTSASLSTGMKMFLATAAATQAAAIGAAHFDISRRNASQLQGAKIKWRAITLISVVGPGWYFLRGRR